MASEAAQLWLDTYMETGKDKEAVLIAYPDTGNNAKDREQAIRVRAAQLKAKYADKICERLVQEITTDSPKMLSILRDLATNSKSESVKLGAVKDWLDRAGFKNETPQEKVTIIVNTAPCMV